jgi:hypothetical protein
MRAADARAAMDPAATEALLTDLAELAAPYRRPDGTLAFPSRTRVAEAEA